METEISEIKTYLVLWVKLGDKLWLNEQDKCFQLGKFVINSFLYRFNPLEGIVSLRLWFQALFFSLKYK